MTCRFSVGLLSRHDGQHQQHQRPSRSTVSQMELLCRDERQHQQHQCPAVSTRLFSRHRGHHQQHQSPLFPKMGFFVEMKVTCCSSNGAACRLEGQQQRQLPFLKGGVLAGTKTTISSISDLPSLRWGFLADT